MVIESIVNIISWFFIFAGIVILGICLFEGFRKGTYKSLAKLARIIASVILSLFFAVVFSYILKAFIPLSGILEKAIPEDVVKASPSLINLAEETARVFTAFVLFWVFFLVCLPALKIPAKKLVNYLETKQKPKGDRIWGILISLITAFAIISVFFFPMAGGLDLANEITENILKDETNDDNVIRYIRDGREYIVSPLSKNPVFMLAGIPGKPLFNTLMTVKIDGTKGRLNDELNAVAKLYSALMPLISENIKDYGEDQAKALENVAATLEDADLLCLIAGEVISNAATGLMNEGSFAGISLSDSDKDNAMIGEMLDILSKTDGKAVKNDVKTTAKLFGVLESHSAFDLFSKESDIMEVVSRKGLISGVVETVYSYNRFRSLTAGLVNTAFESAAESMGTGSNTLNIDNSQLPDLDSEEIIRESLLIEDTAVLIIGFVKSINDNDILNSDFVSMGKALDNAKKSRILGNRVKPLIEVFLHSEKAVKMNVFTGESIEKILNAEGDYENLFASIIKTVDFAKAVSDRNASAAEAILWFTENTDPASADIISAFITPDLLDEYGIKGDSSDKMSEMMSSYITNLGNAAGMTEEKAETESKCVSYVYAIAETGGQRPIFGESIPSAGELVNTFMDSEIFSKTVEDSIYDEEGHTLDPFKIGENINDDEQQALIDALEDYIKENANETNKDRLKRKTVSLGSIIGSDVSGIVDGWIGN